jgi:glutathione S-transferase
MKLYYSLGACSLSPHIVALEAGIPLEIERIDLKTKTTAGGKDFAVTNSKGQVPALELDDGRVLTEGPAIVQYLADLKPESKLVPPAGSFERYQMMEMLNFITSEVHKAFSPLFDAAASADWKAGALAHLKKKFDWLETYLGGKKYLFGEQFTAADAYLFTVLSWIKPLKIDLSPWPVLAQYRLRVAERPNVKGAMRAEGLLK